MARVSAFKHRSGVSITNQDAAGAETMTTTGGGLLVHTDPKALSINHPVVSTGENDSGRDTYYASESDVILHTAGSGKAFGGRADNFALGWGAAFGTHPTTTPGSAQIGVTGYYRNTWDLVGTPATVRAFTMAEAGDPDNTDTDLNMVSLANVVSSFSVEGQAGGVCIYALSMLHGGSDTASGAPITIVDRSNRVFGFDRHVFLNLTTTNSYLAPTPFTIAPSKANALTDSYLHATGRTGDFRDDLRAFKLSVDTSFDVEGSMQGGGTSYITKADEWVISDQKTVLDLTFIHGTVNVKGLRDVYMDPEDAFYGIELVLGHPNLVATGAYAGFIAAFAQMVPIAGSWDQFEQSGVEYVRLSFRPIGDATTVPGKFAALIDSSVAIAS